MLTAAMTVVETVTQDELLRLIDQAAEEGWTELDLSGKGLTELPPEIGQLANLSELNLYGNQITQIPEAIGQLANLSVLRLYGNQITQIPEAIGQLANLSVLNLSSNQITQIPEAIGQLVNLSVLYLHSNQITQIPEAIGQLVNLSELYLFSNQITQIPEAIGQLVNLSVLDLSSNQITQIPEAIRQLANLSVLRLYGNQITQIPDAIRQLANLSELYLDSNQITQIPEAIRQLANLSVLDLYGNQITQIPEAIRQLANLSVLNLYSNQITQIPDAIGQLANLSVLDLHSNQITQIPICLESLSKLTKLDLRRNPLPISPEILGASGARSPSSPRTVFNYCRELRSGEKRQLNEAKLLLIGQGDVGKTSLIKRLIYDIYNRNQPQTDGLEVTTWPIQANTNEVRINVWDFGGQEIYHATHQFFLTKRSLYILTCNCRTSEEENRIEYWLKLIQNFGGDSPVIIVGNKYDEQPLDINRKALRTKYPNIKAILETSCASGHGIEELRQHITHEVAQLDDVYNLLPLTWFEVKEQLESMEEDFISYSRYVGLCHSEKVTREDSQEQLVDLLHNLGLILNFREHPILRDTNVLKPDWVTAGIYAILSDEILKIKTKGILSPADLSRILDPDRYPTKRHDYLIKLMQEFQLCFPLPNACPEQFLIPGLLPKDEPENISLTGETLEFQYHYCILPDSIISRFIVLSHEDIHNQTYWRSGVMLHYKEGTEIYNIARIKADPVDQKIFIAISGKDSTRRSFLNLIRKTFTQIHSSFAEPEITEWVPVPGHPDHPPLDYQELLGLEKMGIQDYPIGKLNIRVNIRQLLDGYEPRELRQLRHRDRLHEEDIPEDFQGNLTINKIYNTNQQSQGDYKPVSNTTNQQGDNISIGGNVTGSNLINGNNNTVDSSSSITHQHGQGDNIGGDKVLGNKIDTQINYSNDLAAAARDIRTLFTELDQTYDRTTPTGQMMIAAKTVEAIENQPTVKQRLLNAIKEGSATALEEMVEHPAIKPVVAAIKGYIDA